MSLKTQWIAYAQLMRLPAIFTAISNIIAAHWIATEGDLQPIPLIITVIASALMYSAGMILNDCFDLAEDTEERPNRPLPANKISVKTAWTIGWVGLVAGAGLASTLSATSAVIAFTLATSIILYNGYAKAGEIGPTVMAACRYLNWLLGFSVVTLNHFHWLMPLPIFAYVLALTLLSRAESRAEDNKAIFSCGITLLVAAILIVWLIVRKVYVEPLALIPLALGVVYIAVRLANTYRAFTPATIQMMMRTLILGIIPLDAIMLFAAGHAVGAALLLTLMLPGRWLAKRMYVT